MQNSVFRPSSLRVVAIAIAVILAPALAAAAEKTVLDCGNGKNTHCIECCCTPNMSPEECAACSNPNGIYCCPLPSCDIVFVTTPPVSGIKLNAAVGGVKVKFQRKGEDGLVDLKLKQVLASTVSRRTVSVKAQLTGADASIGSLLYPVAFLGIGVGAQNTLQEMGYDITVANSGSLQTCQAVLPDATCRELAIQLAQRIDGSIVGDRAERNAFLQGILDLGYGSCASCAP